jgi:hypothetical protein
MFASAALMSTPSCNWPALRDTAPRIAEALALHRKRLQRDRRHFRDRWCRSGVNADAWRSPPG